MGPPQGATNAPAEAGKAAHRAFEYWLAGATPDKCLEVFTTAYKPFADAFITADDRLSLDNLSRILSVFFAQAPLNSMPFDVEEAWIEKQVKAEIGGGVWHSTKPDGVVLMKDTGMRLVFELKTTSYIGDKFFDKYDLDAQITAHVGVLRRQSYNVSGVLLFALQFNKLPHPSYNKDGTERKCRECHIPVSQCWPQHVKWDKRPFQRTPDAILDWENTVIAESAEYGYYLEQVEREGLGVAILKIPQEGILHNECGACELKPFCEGHRRRLDLLVQRPEEAGIMHSGLIE